MGNAVDHQDVHAGGLDLINGLAVPIWREQGREAGIEIAAWHMVNIGAAPLPAFGILGQRRAKEQTEINLGVRRGEYDKKDNIGPVIGDCYNWGGNGESGG